MGRLSVVFVAGAIMLIVSAAIAVDNELNHGLFEYVSDCRTLNGNECGRQLQPADHRVVAPILLVMGGATMTAFCAGRRRRLDEPSYLDSAPRPVDTDWTMDEYDKDR